MIEKRPLTIAFYLPYLTAGGAERVVLTLLDEFQLAGVQCLLLVNRLKQNLTGSGPSDALAQAVPDGVEVVELGVGRSLSAPPAIAATLRKTRPDCMISSLGHSNAAAVIGRQLSGLSIPLIARQDNTLSAESKLSGNSKNRALPVLYRRIISHSDAVVCVSRGVSEDICATVPGFPQGRLHVINNPVVGRDFGNRLNARDPGTWPEGRRRLVAAGRLQPAKDYPTLFAALRLVADKIPISLRLLGQGPLLGELTTLRAKLGLDEIVSFEGFVPNPLPVFRSAELFVLSSRYEGFGNVLVEALGAGCPVVTADCPSGPSEILEGGQWGRLVPPGDAQALAVAILANLEMGSVCTVDAQVARAQAFHAGAIASRYLDLVEELRARRAA
jgi:glycosyltransferase involved in cell wall biosynthesis